MGADSSLVFTTIFPSIGAVLSNIFYIVTAKAVLDSRKTGVLQINPIPFPFTLTGTICWVVYSTMTSNYYVYIANIFGMLYQLFAFMTVYSLCERKIKDVLEYAVIALSSILAITAISMTFFREEKAIMLWGLMSNIITIGVLCSPLSTIRNIIKNRDASIIYLPLGIATLTNCFLWVVYGFSVRDLYVAMPNVVGVAMALTQIVLKVMYTKPSELFSNKSSSREADPEAASLLQVEAGSGVAAVAASKDNATVFKRVAFSSSNQETEREPGPVAPPRGSEAASTSAPEITPVIPVRGARKPTAVYVSPSAPYLCARPPNITHEFFRVYKEGMNDVSFITRRLDVLCKKIRPEAVRQRLAASKPLYFIVTDPTQYIEFAPLASIVSFDGRSFLDGVERDGMVAFADNPESKIPGFFSTRLLTCNHGYREEDIIIHEFLHSVHQSGLTDEMCERLDALYDQYNVPECALYDTKTYAFASCAEFFAEMGQVYLSCTARLDVTGGITQHTLRGTLPDMHAFLSELFHGGDELYRLGCPCKRCFFYRPLP